MLWEGYDLLSNLGNQDPVAFHQLWPSGLERLSSSEDLQRAEDAPACYQGLCVHAQPTEAGKAALEGDCERLVHARQKKKKRREKKGRGWSQYFREPVPLGTWHVFRILGRMNTSFSCDVGRIRIPSVCQSVL